MNHYNPKVIGAFVVGALALAMMAVAVLGYGVVLREEYNYVLCFPGDLSGLNVGAPVEFRGVPIGIVSAIRLNIGNLPPLVTSSSAEARIPVIIKLRNTKIILGERNGNLAKANLLSEAIRRGLRGQLRLESFVTGVSYVSLDIVPGTPAVLCLSADSGYREIPTVPTTLEQAQDTLHQLIAKMEEADLEGMISSARSAMRGIDQLVSDPALQAGHNFIGRTEANRASLRGTSAALRSACVSSAVVLIPGSHH